MLVSEAKHLDCVVREVVVEDNDQLPSGFTLKNDLLHELKHEIGLAALRDPELSLSGNPWPNGGVESACSLGEIVV